MFSANAIRLTENNWFHPAIETKPTVQSARLTLNPLLTAILNLAPVHYALGGRSCLPALSLGAALQQ